MKTKPTKGLDMFKTLIAAIIALFTGAAVTTMKKDKVILELQRELNHVKSFEYTRSIFRDGYDAGKIRGWLDRNMSPEIPSYWKE